MTSCNDIIARGPKLGYVACIRIRYPKQMRNILDGIMNASYIVEFEENVFVWLSIVPSCHLDVRSLSIQPDNEAPLMQSDKSIADLAS